VNEKLAKILRLQNTPLHGNERPDGSTAADDFETTTERELARIVERKLVLDERKLGIEWKFVAQRKARATGELVVERKLGIQRELAVERKLGIQWEFAVERKLGIQRELAFQRKFRTEWEFLVQREFGITSSE
jgi:hypothetical protein